MVCDGNVRGFSRGLERVRDAVNESSNGSHVKSRGNVRHLHDWVGDAPLASSMCLQEDEEREKRSEEHRERMKKEHKKNIEVSRFIFAEGRLFLFWY